MENLIIYDWTKKENIDEVKKIYGINLTDSEFKVFMNIGMSTGLNPFLREIYAVKYGNQAQIFIGRDGYRKVAQQNPDYDYHQADAVYENDDFFIENGEIKHKYSLKNRGKIIGAYCITKRKSSTKPVFLFVEIKEYHTQKSIWLTKPATMIKKVAEAQGLKMAFQSLFSGTYDESEEWQEQKKEIKNIVPKLEEKKIPEILERIEKENEPPSEKQKKFALVEWDALYSYLMAYDPNFTKKKKESARHAFILREFKKNSLTELAKDELEKFIKIVQEKIEEYKNKKQIEKKQKIETIKKEMEEVTPQDIQEFFNAT